MLVKIVNTSLHVLLQIPEVLPKIHTLPPLKKTNPRQKKKKSLFFAKSSKYAPPPTKNTTP